MRTWTTCEATRACARRSTWRRRSRKRTTGIDSANDLEVLVGVNFQERAVLVEDDRAGGGDYRSFFDVVTAAHAMRLRVTLALDAEKSPGHPRLVSDADRAELHVD